VIGLPTLDEMIVSHNASLRDAMKVIEINTQGVCFVVSNSHVVGILSDGDIRRALINGVQIENPACDIMQRDFVVLPVTATLEEIQSTLNEKIRHIPMIDADGMLVDYACAYRYHQVPLIQPALDGNELEYVTDCIKTGWISSQGKFVRKFEDSFGAYVGNYNTLAVCNGTVALHLALVTLGIGPGDEVIVPDLTFAASVNAVLYVGATPVLVDIDPYTLALDVDAVELALTERTRAIIPVHLYGHPADMSRVTNLAKKYNLLIIEDCAEAIGSLYEGKHVGNFSDVAIFSFFGNKTITTGEGGMLIFKDPVMKERAVILRDHGMSKERRYWHDLVGYNYRLTNIQAAIGVAQMERVGNFIEKKRWNASQYNKRLSSVKGLRLPGEFGEVVSSYWFYTVILPIELASVRDDILKLMIESGVESRPTFYPMHSMPPYAPFVKNGQTFPVSEMIAKAGISLPSGVNMNEADVDKVCVVLTKIVAKYRLSNNR
jgi:perosamine synthetase